MSLAQAAMSKANKAINIDINAGHNFTTTTDRDTFFTNNSTQLKDGMYIYCNGQLQRRENNTWVNRSTAIKGDKGDTFKYSDFTTEQLALLKGDKGDPFTYDDFTQEQLDALKGSGGSADLSALNLNIIGTSLQLRNGTTNLGTPQILPSVSNTDVTNAVNSYMTANPVSATVGTGSIGAGELNGYVYNGIVKETILKNYTYPGGFNTVTTHIDFLNEVIPAGYILSIAFKGTASKKFNVCYYTKSGTTYSRYYYIALGRSDAFR